MKTDKTGKSKSRPVAFWAVAALVLACVGGAVFLIPSDSQVMKRLTADGKIQRLREIVSEKTGSEPTDAELLEHAVGELGKGGWDETGTQAVEKLALGIEDTRESFDTITRLEGELPPRPTAAIYSRMAKRALANNQPKLASDIFQKLGDLSGMSEDRITEVVSALRASEAPAEALDALGKFKDDNGGELPVALEELYSTLALESGKVDVAFDAAREGFEKRKQRSPEEMRKAINKLMVTGAHAGRTEELIPLCEEYLATTEAGKLDWHGILKRRKENPSFSDPEFEQVALEAAKFSRWNNQPDKSFDLFRKLAALGSPGALEECVSLHKPLLREAEMADILDAFVPVEGKPEYTLLAAEIHAKRTDYEQADGLYRKHLAAYPEDTEIWDHLAGMWDSAGKLGFALEAYKKGAAIDPSNTKIQKRITRTLVSLGDFKGALAHLGSQKKYDRKTLTQYMTLAESLDNPVAANDALRKWFTLPGQRRAIDYSRLGLSYGALGRNDDMIKVYRRGIQKFPKDRALKIELARELSQLRRHSEVMSSLAGSGLRNDPEAISLHLSSALAVKDFRRGLAFAGSNAENRLDLPVSAKIPLAEIYYQTGSVSKSNKLYNSISSSELPTITRATLAHRRGQYPEAERLLEGHLATNKKDHSGWSFLASVYQAQRKKPEAKRAYQRALELLKVDMRRR